MAWGSHMSNFHRVTQYGSKIRHRSMTGVTCDTTHHGSCQLVFAVSKNNPHRGGILTCAHMLPPSSQRKSSQKRDFELRLHASDHLKNNPPKGRIPRRWDKNLVQEILPEGRIINRVLLIEGYLHISTFYSVVLLIVTYGSIAFWDGKSSAVKNTLECMQNKALHFITGAFKTTPIHALEIESSIPPINITLDYYMECYATCTQRLNHSNPVMCCIPNHHREDILIQLTPLPCFPPPPKNLIAPYLIRQHKAKIKKTMTTQLICMAKGITNNMECISPHAEPPWHRLEYDYDIHDCIRLYIPENRAGTSVKTEWAEDHANLYDEYKGDSEVMFIYTDRSLSYNNGIHRTGYSIVAYRNGTEIASVKGSMGEHVEVYDTKMRALEVAVELIHKLINSETSTPPSKIIIATNNMGTLQWIFRGSPGKAQGSSITFHKHILNILDQHENTQFALTCCPGHFNIEGNE